MGIITIEKMNHLFWLGRYTERITGNIRLFMECYDQMIDIDENAYIDFCNNLSIDHLQYKNSNDFIERFIYDASMVDSIISVINNSFSNALVLREEITGDTLAYIDLCRNALMKKEKDVLFFELQQILDHINAFWGSGYDTIDDDSLNIILCGKYAERVELEKRFSINTKDSERMYKKLIDIVNRLNSNYKINGLTEVLDKLMNSLESEDVLSAIEKLTYSFGI